MTKGIMLHRQRILREVLCKSLVSWYWPQPVNATYAKNLATSTGTFHSSTASCTRNKATPTRHSPSSAQLNFESRQKKTRFFLTSNTRPRESPIAPIALIAPIAPIAPHMTPGTHPSMQVVDITLHNRQVQVTVTDSALEVARWIDRRKRLTAFGVDVEWKPTFAKGEYNRVALLQIGAEEACLLVQLLYIDRVPEVLLEFLANPSIAKLGVGIAGDLQKLRMDYGIVSEGAVDIGGMAKNRYPDLSKTSLQNLALQFAGYSYPKNKGVSTSDWSKQQLSERQVVYAANDAWTAWLVHQALLSNSPPSFAQAPN